MAPTKGAKRNAKAQEAQDGKKAKKDPMLKAVADALVAAKGVPENSRLMLMAGLQGSLGVPGEHRHEVQDKFVRMIDEVVVGVAAELQSEVDAGSASVEGLQRSTGDLGAKVAVAEAALAVAVEEVAARRLTLAEATAKATACRAILSEKQEAHRSGDATLEQVEQKKARVEQCIETDLKAVMEGQPGQAAKSFQALQSVLEGISLDETLANALPSACHKQPSERGPFDVMVLEQLDKSLRETVVELTRTLQEGAATRGDLAVAVEVAQSEHAAAEAFQLMATEELAAADGRQREASGRVASAKSVVDACEPQLAKAVEALESKQAELDNFKAYNLSCWETLRARAEEKIMAPPEEASTHIAVGGA